MKYTLFILAGIGIAIFFLFSRGGHKPVNCVAPYDLSGTTDSSELARYIAVTKQHVLPNLGTEGRFTAIPVDQHSQTASEELYSINYGLHDYQNDLASNQEEYRQRMHGDSVLASAKLFEESILKASDRRAKFNNNSDIIGSMREAVKHFDSSARNVMMLFTDGQHCASGINFETMLSTNEDAERFLSETEPIDLSQWEVILYTGPQKMGITKYKAIEHFWKGYVSQNGGKLIEYSSGSTATISKLLSGK